MASNLHWLDPMPDAPEFGYVNLDKRKNTAHEVPKLQCVVCGFVGKSQRGLSLHLKMQHKIGPIDKRCMDGAFLALGL